jgi:hypothetical protein
MGHHQQCSQVRWTNASALEAMKASLPCGCWFAANAIADLTRGALCVIFELHPEEGRKPEMIFLPAMGIGEGDEPMFPMKKPIRLLAMRFQVD